jgi:argininosuccinate lyase
MQEDKEAVFDAADTLRASLRVAAVVIDNVTLNEAAARAASETGFLNATELADHLVKKGVPFRRAHDAVGKAVLYASEKGVELGELSLEEIRRFAPDADEDVFEALSLENTLNSKSQTGGTSRLRVREALEKAKKDLGG